MRLDFRFLVLKITTFYGILFMVAYVAEQTVCSRLIDEDKKKGQDDHQYGVADEIDQDRSFGYAFRFRR